MTRREDVHETLLAITIAIVTQCLSGGYQQYFKDLVDAQHFCKVCHIAPRSRVHKRNKKCSSSTGQRGIKEDALG